MAMPWMKADKMPLPLNESGVLNFCEKVESVLILGKCREKKKAPLLLV
jgi:hypothetical protein